jgi:hypothetical protein
VRRVGARKSSHYPFATQNGSATRDDERRRRRLLRLRCAPPSTRLGAFTPERAKAKRVASAQSCRGRRCGGSLWRASRHSEQVAKQVASAQTRALQHDAPRPPRIHSEGAGHSEQVAKQVASAPTRRTSARRDSLAARLARARARQEPRSSAQTRALQFRTATATACGTPTDRRW